MEYDGETLIICFYSDTEREVKIVFKNDEGLELKFITLKIKPYAAVIDKYMEFYAEENIEFAQQLYIFTDSAELIGNKFVKSTDPVAQVSSFFRKVSSY